MLPPRFPRRRLQRLCISGLIHAASAPAAYASRMMLPPPMQSSLPAGWLSLYREGVEPSGSLQKVSVRLILLFWTLPGAREVSSCPLRTECGGRLARHHLFSEWAGHYLVR